MDLYWPNMYTVKANGKIERYFTYSPCLSAEKAVKVIDNWIEYKAEGERPIISWINVQGDSDNEKIIRKVEYGAQLGGALTNEHN